MKHNISISTAEALLINKALRVDLKNDTDNKMAERLRDKIMAAVEWDLQEHRCYKCREYMALENRKKGSCILRCYGPYRDIRYGNTKACKNYRERRECSEKNNS